MMRFFDSNIPICNSLMIRRTLGMGRASSAWMRAIYHFYALLTVGTLFCYGGPCTGGGTNYVSAWGNNAFGQTNVPPSLTNVVAIAAGFSHSLALKSDGTVVAWGNNDNGQTNTPPDLSSVVAIAGGWYHSLALKSDGTVASWGAGMTNGGSAPDFGQSIVRDGPP